MIELLLFPLGLALGWLLRSRTPKDSEMETEPELALGLPEEMLSQLEFQIAKALEMECQRALEMQKVLAQDLRQGQVSILGNTQEQG